MKSYKHIYDKVGSNIGINPTLLRAIAVSTTQEAPETILQDGKTYHYGLMYLSLPGANLVGYHGEKEALLSDIELNIYLGALYFRYLLQQYQFDVKKALVAYLKGKYDSRYIHHAEKILMTWRNIIKKY